MKIDKTEFHKVINPVGLVEKEKLVAIDNDVMNKYNDGILGFETKAFSKAEKHFINLSKKLAEIASNNSELRAVALASSYAMEFNSLCMKCMDDFVRGKYHPLIPSLKQASWAMNKALEYEPYWDEYIIREDNLSGFIHDTVGCPVIREGDEWKIGCPEICRKLGMMGVSIEAESEHECSICGKDPLGCEHVTGEVYNGRRAIHVVKNLRGLGVALVNNPQVEAAYVIPRPLDKSEIKQFFPQMASKIFKDNIELSCKDLPIELLRRRKNPVGLGQKDLKNLA